MDIRNLKNVRKEKGLSQMKVAQELGVNINTYINWERGTANPNWENMIKLDKFFDNL